jgi:hypothetical protein
MSLKFPQWGLIGHSRNVTTAIDKRSSNHPVKGSQASMFDDENQVPQYNRSASMTPSEHESFAASRMSRRSAEQRASDLQAARESSIALWRNCSTMRSARSRSQEKRRWASKSR